MNEFKKVVQQRNYGYWDTFEDGSEIPEGDYLVRFPDGSEEPHAVKIKRDALPYGDMGQIYHGRFDSAYIETELRGQTIKVMLVGLYIKRLEPFDNLVWVEARTSGGVIMTNILYAKVTYWLAAFINSTKFEYTVIGVVLNYDGFHPSSDGRRHLYIHEDQIDDERRYNLDLCKRLAVAACSRFLHEERQKVLALLPPEESWE